MPKRWRKDTDVRYFDEIIALLNEIQATQHEAMERAAQVIANAIAADHLVYVFGATHAGILAQELFYRAGGLVPVNPVLLPGLVTDVRPVHPDLPVGAYGRPGDRNRGRVTYRGR